MKHGLTVFQPERIKRAEAIEQLRTYPADIFVVAAFGQILSEEILSMPKYGCVNIHASLLPKYRGAAPIQWAVINGDEESGVTIMQMDAGIDTGDILAQERIKLNPKETGESLFERLSHIGASLLVATLQKIENGAVTPMKQNADESCYAAMLTKESGKIDWRKSNVVLERLIRGLNSWPSAYTCFHGKVMKLWDADCVSLKQDKAPGTIVEVNRDSVVVACGQGALKLNEIQLAGKKRMYVKDFLLGYHLSPGELFGTQE